MHEFFRCQKLSETQKGCIRKFTGTGREKIVIPPVLLLVLLLQHFHDNIQVQNTESQQEGHYATVEKNRRNPRLIPPHD